VTFILSLTVFTAWRGARLVAGEQRREEQRLDDLLNRMNLHLGEEWGNKVLLLDWDGPAIPERSLIWAWAGPW